MCAATPVFTALPGSVCGPAVDMPQSGFEHRLTTRFASTAFKDALKSSRGMSRDAYHLR